MHEPAGDFYPASVDFQSCVAADHSNAVARHARPGDVPFNAL
jgi:hypothetical protein